MILGIDPGFTGALAFLVSNKDVTIFDMPVMPMPNGKKQINLQILTKIISHRREDIAFAVIEKVGSMPGQGVASTFAFGVGYGMVLGVLAGAGIETRFVTPQKWKKAFSLTKDKGLSRTIATKCFPDRAEYFMRVKDDGRAEAALIALYGSQNPTSLL